MRHARSIALFVVFAVVVLVVDAVACPTCKDGLAAADSQGANIARGYFYSILLMLAMPFTLAGSFGLYVWREMRRQQQAGTTGEVMPGEHPGSDSVIEGGRESHYETRLPAATM
jgi:heme/copper-type cytochrome/quinol oxidase subunit 2